MVALIKFPNLPDGVQPSLTAATPAIPTDNIFSCCFEAFKRFRRRKSSIDVYGNCAVYEPDYEPRNERECGCCESFSGERLLSAPSFGGNTSKHDEER